MIEDESRSIAIELEAVGSEYVKMIDLFGTFSFDGMDKLIEERSGFPGKHNPLSVFYFLDHTPDRFSITENMGDLIGEPIRENPRYSSDFPRRNFLHRIILQKFLRNKLSDVSTSDDSNWSIHVLHIIINAMKSQFSDFLKFLPY